MVGTNSIIFYIAAFFWKLSKGQAFKRSPKFEGFFLFLFAIFYFIFLTLVVAMQRQSKKWHQQIIKLGQQQPTNMFATKLYYTSTIPTYVHIRLIYTPHTHTHLIIAIDTLQTQTLIYIVSVRLLSSDFEGSKLVRILVKN